MHVSISTLTPSVLYQLGKDDMTAFLKDHPEVAKQLCQQLAYRQDALGKLTTQTSVQQEKGQSLFQWLFDKVRHLHSLHDDS
jgi:CRP-like cAMP-binding protein